MIESGLKSFRAVQERVLGKEITYIHQGEEYRVIAVLGKTIFRTQDDYGAYIRYEARDFIVKAGLLNFEPESGDKIICLGSTYEVLAPHGESVSRWSDPEKTALRIHTKEVL